MTRVPDQEAKKSITGRGGAINRAASPAASLSPRHWEVSAWTESVESIKSSSLLEIQANNRVSDSAYKDLSEWKYLAERQK